MGGWERNDDDNNSSSLSRRRRRTGLGESGKDGVWGGGGLTTAGRGVHEPRGEGGDSLCLCLSVCVEW